MLLSLILAFILLPIEKNFFFQKKYNEKYTISSYGFSSYKITFILLTKIIIFNLQVARIRILIPSFGLSSRRIFLRLINIWFLPLIIQIFMSCLSNILMSVSIEAKVTLGVKKTLSRVVFSLNLGVERLL